MNVNLFPWARLRNPTFAVSLIQEKKSPLDCHRGDQKYLPAILAMFAEIQIKVHVF
jgi:hypothetical protein